MLIYHIKSFLAPETHAYGGERERERAVIRSGSLKMAFWACSVHTCCHCSHLELRWNQKWRSSSEKKSGKAEFNRKMWGKQNIWRQNETSERKKRRGGCSCLLLRTSGGSSWSFICAKNSVYQFKMLQLIHDSKHTNS